MYRIFSGIAAVSVWITLLLQLYLIIINSVTPLLETLVRYFSFFTIESNILVAVCLTSFALADGKIHSGFWLRSSTLIAVTTYIVIVGTVYNLILRALWSPTGLQLIVDEMLHSVIPIIFFMLWLVVLPKNDINWNIVGWLLLYPAFYIIVILLRGALSGFYPYPFINAIELSFGRLVLNCFFLFLCFMLFGALITIIAKKLSNNRSK